MMKKTEILYHSGAFKENFVKNIDFAMYFTTEEFHGKCTDKTFVIKRRKGRIIKNINPYYAEGTIFEDRIEYLYAKHKICNCIYYCVMALTFATVIFSFFLALYNGYSLLKSLSCFLLLLLPIYIYILPAVLYDDDDCDALKKILMELCES